MDKSASEIIKEQMDNLEKRIHWLLCKNCNEEYANTWPDDSGLCGNCRPKKEPLPTIKQKVEDDIDEILSGQDRAAGEGT